MHTASSRIRSLHTVTGFRVFIDPGTQASPSAAQDLTALAVHILDAIGFFRCPSEGTVLYLAVHEFVQPAGAWSDQQNATAFSIAH